MGADLSRVRFDARSDHAGVILQQGRVLLDADWNELVAINDRRMRAAAVDFMSPGPNPAFSAIVAVPKTTPDAFALSFVGGKLMIGRGRMYVDGIVAENHGVGTPQWRHMLEDVSGAEDTPYAAQPYLPVTPAVPATGTYLAYLDVWHREVTPLEQPDLVEPALGVDTTTRTQVAWVVRLHEVDGPGAAVCSTPDDGIAGWPEVVAPSGARLSVGTIPVDDDDDPCALPPSGGYRGLENQTYRVEVHSAGGLGTATFKWSRDNASVASPVVEVLTGGLGVRPASLGRDSVLRFADGDWVEITDDQREMSGLAGEIRFAEVHEEDGTVRFTPALPADLTLTTAQAAARHLRIRRWDQKGQVKSGAGGNLTNLLPTSSGVITVPAGATTSVVLEHGVTVSFSGTNFKVGDHWIFAARVADTSVEELTEAPPLGVHHHYARLGFVTFPGSVVNCPHPWPPDCDCEEGGDGCSDCTVCVTPESHASGALTIQMAVDQVKALGGGTVCLRPGIFALTEGGVVIDTAVSVKVRGVGPMSLVVADTLGFAVTNSAFVTLEDFSIISRGRAAVDARATLGMTLQRLTVLDVPRVDVPVAALQLSGVSLLTTIRDCAVIAATGIASGPEGALLTGELRINDNLLVCRDGGIRLLAGHLFSNALMSNTIVRCEEAGVTLPGAMAPGHGCEVSDNTLYVEGLGIAVSASGFTVDDNDVTGIGDSNARAYGIAVLPGQLGSLFGPTRISGNRVNNRVAAGIAVAASVTEITITDNHLKGVGQGIAMVRGGGADLAEVTHNRIVDVGTIDGTAVGILVAGASTAHVESNVLNRLGALEASRLAIGIFLAGCPVSRVGSNGVDGLGTIEQIVPSVGIAVTGVIDTTQVSGNTVRRQAIEVDKDQPGSYTGLIIGNSQGVLAGGKIGLSGTHAVLAAIGGPSAVTVDGNTVSGNREVPGTVIEIEGSAIVSANQLLSPLEGATALRLTASSATVGNNRLRGGNPSAELNVDPKQLAVLGNLTTNGIEVFGSPLSAPWDQLNPNGVV